MALNTKIPLAAYYKGLDQAFIMKAIDKIVEDKKKRGIFPARATWLELKGVLKAEHWPLLDELVELGRVTRQESINYTTYAVDWKKVHADEAWLKKHTR